MMRRPIVHVTERVGKHFYQAKIVKLNGEVIDLSSLGFEVVQMSDPGPDQSILSEELENQDGYIDVETSLSGRSISLTILFLAHTFQDAALRKRDLNSLLNLREAFYLRTNAEPGKQVRVRRKGNVEIADLGAYTFSASIELESPSPYWESIRGAFEEPNAAAEGFGFGQGYDVSKISNSKTTDNYVTLYNNGSVRIDPRNVLTPLTIRVDGATENLRILNSTNGSLVELYTATGNNDVLLFDRVRILKNSFSIFGLSNHGALILEPGKNELLLQGKGKEAVITFDAKNYYI